MSPGVGRRERLGWAVLFALPPGVGVAMATARMAVAPATDPLVVGAGLGTAALVFLLVFGAASAPGSEPPEAA